MKNSRIILVLLAVAFTHAAFSQKLKMYKTFGGVIFEINDSLQLSVKQTATLMFENKQAYNEFKKSRTTSTVSAIMGFTGAATMAIPVVTLAFGESSDWALAGGGAALIVGSIFVNRASKARALYAVDLYNEGLTKKSSRIQPQFHFYGTGASLVIKF
ncbi:hypothetical protein WSM22_20610 [Cytophagales bacterium WSM2-2]|nr:hypothetical protein WSM22_20610 [Cytophagales bacterium WSM2-2]